MVLADWYATIPEMVVDRVIVYVGPMHVFSADSFADRSWTDEDERAYSVRIPRSPFLPVFAFSSPVVLMSFLDMLMRDPVAYAWHNTDVDRKEWACMAAEYFHARF
jgi:hypothetical protein